MTGAEAADDFIFELIRLGSVVKPRAGRLPHFELLLRTTSVGGSAQGARLVASRMYPQQRTF